MIKWIAGNDKEPVKTIGIGVDEDNLRELRNGRPILALGAEMGVPFNIVIHFGETIEALLASIGQKIDKNTVIHDHRNVPTTKQ